MPVTEGSAFTLLFVGGYIVFVIVWIMLIVPRLRPRLRDYIGARLGVTIVERRQFRAYKWEIAEPHNRQQGCLVTIAEYGVDFGCLGLPIFLVLALVVIAMMILSGGG